jgi:FlaA1/EpsC-like NDP-sugar epimerase
MVSGGAGSIGSEIVRQLINYHPAEIVIVDNAETPVFELRQELFEKHEDLKHILTFVIADVTDKNRISKIFAAHHPSIIYHAAAYKHVPLMEDNPEESLRVNVLGTKTMADLAIEFEAERFVMVSTDKAVRPTNVMGASKRLAEMYCQSLGQSKKTSTKFVTTRFGNVLGSNGSVVKIFRKQISEGGPVTVTHPEITRFFMTIPEACQLVIEASIMGIGSDIFVFDMGSPVKVVDLARKMIKLAGFDPDKDIGIVFSGLRPGEKLFEELLSHSENTIETYHPKIMIAQVDHILNGSVTYMINEIREALNEDDQYHLVSLLKKAIPEYISNNSKFQRLDHLSANSV